MTTAHYRRRQRELAEYYDRAALAIVAIGCAVVTAAWSVLLVEVLL